MKQSLFETPFTPARNSHVLWVPKVKYRIHKSPLLLVPSRARSIQSTALPSSSEKLMLILSSHLYLGIHSGYVPSLFPVELQIHCSPFTLCYMPHASDFVWTDHPNVVWGAVATANTAYLKTVSILLTEICLFCDWPSWLLWRERIEVILTVEHSRYRIIVNRHFDRTLHRFLNISFAFVHLAIWMAVAGWPYFTSKERNRMVYCVLIVSTFISLFFQHSSYKQCKQQGRRGLFVWGAKCFSCRKLWTYSNVRQCIGSRRVLSAHFTPRFLVECFPFVVLFSIVSYNM